ncbi:MAG: xanthine dehydrogenase family protein molybdopterin-binding subunit [Acidimicrobiales bacterium]|nr:xanthine dehydrogenase family protein molybdopterin-binding subunit [Acidimicrobiales bacterium]MCB9394376.1 xanthine dehydrogenase family protein molybdopterin-binding subunit [Acidimicrobiaceae bacterium]
MTVTEPAPTSRFVRADGPDKVTGSGRYAADLTLTGVLQAAFRYADVTHGRITRLDVEPARSMPGVLAVLTAADVPDVRYGPFVADRTLFARDVVRFEGEIVAAVAATSAEIARRAAAAIVVEYEPLPIVNDVEAALAPDAPLVHADWASYGAADPIVRDRNDASYASITKGDADAAMADADIVLSSRYVADASHAAPIEPRAVLAQWEGDKVTIWSSTQVPFDARAGVCETLGLPANRVRIIVPHLGGGFGGKCGFHVEAHVAALARAARRPVRLVFTRREEFVVPDRRREGMVVELTTGLRGDGTIVARTGRVIIDNGAYTADSGFFSQLAAMHVAGPYRIPHLHVEAHLVYTNHQPSGSVRAPTAPQACWALESHTDELAAAAGLDPVEFRRRNVVDTGSEGPSGQTYDEIGLRRCVDAATAAAGYGRDLPDDEAIGVAVGWWPSFTAASGAFVKIDGDGSAQIVTGAQECGTGAVMTLRQLAADELGMSPDDFQLVYQDTSVAPYDMGATGSQTLFNNGRAVVHAAGQVAEQLKRLAADHLEAAPDDIVLADGQASVAGTPSRTVSIAELAGIAAGGELLIGHGSGAPPSAPALVGSSCVGDVGMAAFVAPQFSCHAVHVKVDRDTGVVRVLGVSAAHDSGTIINQIGARGQVEGGVMMGIGQALTEGTRYDDAGRQRNPAMLEYKLQTCADAPPIHIDFVEIPTPDAGPRGAKGLAEAPNVPTAAAIANAVAQVVGRPVRQLPMTAERVWNTLTGEDGVS